MVDAGDGAGDLLLQEFHDLRPFPQGEQADIEGLAAEGEFFTPAGRLD
jgi:hypothetical protein